MQTRILYIFTRTPLHVGAGSSVGAIDQPVIRERHTRFPIIPGSALKGVISDLWPRMPDNARTPEAAALFGAEDAAAAKSGAVSFGEARLLAFPLRSAKGSFALATCPLALARFFRDTAQTLPALPPLDADAVAVTENTALAFQGDKVIFEEYPLRIHAAKIPAAILAALKPACDDAVWQENIASRLAIVSDELFSYFAANACEIAQHVRIDDEKGTVANGALFNQENVPSETLFYAPLHSKKSEDFAAFHAKFADANGLLQFGGDATTGLGFCSVKLSANPVA